MKEIFRQKMDECYESLCSGQAAQGVSLKEIIGSREQLESCLPLLKQELDMIKQGVADCDSRIKAWQESKKVWKERQNLLLELTEKTLDSLQIKSITDGTVKAAITCRKNLEFVEDELLKPLQGILDQIAAQLPSYVKLSVGIDKTALANHLKTDNSLLLTMPENIHYKESKSIKIS